MDDEADRPGGSRGTARENAVRPALGFRTGLLAIVVCANQLANRLLSTGSAPVPFGARPAWRLTVTHADDQTRPLVAST